VIRALSRRALHAPVDVDFRGWATSQWGSEVAAALCAAAAVFTFDHDPGRLSAAFVWPRLLRVSAVPPPARYPIGGWGTLIDRLAQRARALGVEIETQARVTSLPEPPVIVATDLPAAARLLGDETLRWESGRALCLDLGLERRRNDVFVVSDLDEGGWIERFTAADRSLAPTGAELVQAQVGIRPDESPEDAAGRLERLLDLAFPRRRTRELWRRRLIMDGQSGALDLPGTTWRDRPAIERADGVFLAGDMVAAVGLLSEVAFASGQQAARLASQMARRNGRRAPQGVLGRRPSAAGADR
jgi:phytoene dehydrogenase-like protein